MGYEHYLNIALFTIDSVCILGIILVYSFSTKTYHNYVVPKISTYNDVIDSKNIEKLLIEFKLMFNLKDYEIIYTETDKFIKIFKNLNKKKKQIIISKKIFESVGYEIDYLISRIWISAKQIEKDSKVRTYRATLSFTPKLFMGLMFVGYALQTVIFFYCLSQTTPNATLGTDTTSLVGFMNFLWRIPLIATFIVVLMGALLINYMFLIKAKEIIETEYNVEIVGLVKNVIYDFYNDFVAARTYAQNITLPAIPLMKGNDFWNNWKWMGPFTYM
ncbi:hypothetical protein [[Acholeplasma] multilocale]|uniref:hypothetical protein n=1 Tax=[Acholeplasma] multilocale TaxID=264638 RepID=UPI00047DA1AE|nr:hypothetical protein [[Acholeplasma] multilocale]